MKLRYRYRIYPTLQQEQQMTSVGGAVRFLYNHFLKVNIDQYNQDKTFVWQFDMCKQFTSLKTQHTWLKDTYSQVLQSSIKDLDQALKNIKKTGAGFPKFKSKYTTPISFRYQQHTSISTDGKYAHLPKIGAIRIKLHRSLPSKYTGCTITQTPRGWYASFVVDVAELPLVDQVQNPVGVDVNSQYTALSTGDLIANPRPLKQKQVKIKSLQRKLAKKQKASKNRTKAKLKLARTHDLVRCQRLNHIHQISARIAKSHDLVSVETLKIEEMRKKSKLAAKAIADAGWAMLANAIAYKFQLAGHHFTNINQWLLSSKTCSSCGTKKSSLDLKQREYHCESCGVTQHRDINAAVNIKNWGLQQWNIDHARQELPQAPVDVTWDIMDNWGHVSQSQLKQEVTAL
jgi:putative transposase